MFIISTNLLLFSRVIHHHHSLIRGNAVEWSSCGAWGADGTADVKPSRSVVGWNWQRVPTWWPKESTKRPHDKALTGLGMVRLLAIHHLYEARCFPAIEMTPMNSLYWRLMVRHHNACGKRTFVHMKQNIYHKGQRETSSLWNTEDDL